ncbi:hypothetical protein MauCBS54593_007272 [Microsporum audouinii]
MDACREAARSCLQRAQGNDDPNIYIQDATPYNIELYDLWSDLDGYRDSNYVSVHILVSKIEKLTKQQVLENLLIVEACLRDRKAEIPHDDQDKKSAANSILQWTLGVIPPGENLAATWGEFQLADEERRASILSKYREERIKSTVGIRIISLIEPIILVENTEDILSAVVVFNSPCDPWTTNEGSQMANSFLQKYESKLRHEQGLFETTIENILLKKVKPAFSKTKTPAITPAGRKNVHPIPQPSFDPTLFDTGSKPWKFKEGYIVSILRWVIGQYQAIDLSMIERHFPLLVPAILSFIDDESLAFKAVGCSLLGNLLSPLEQAKSDILRRTNLDSVFQDALSNCLLSIPTITPENESVYLLNFAYPAIFSVIRTRFSSVITHRADTGGQLPSKTKAELEKDAQLRIISISRILRHHIISSYLHTSSPRPAEDTSISSYPHPSLSTLLLKQLTESIDALEIEATKYLQDIIPMLTSTLTNPFGVAYIPLLITAAECYQSVILNCWPRLSRWRGDILAGVCACWLHLCDDEEDGLSLSDEKLEDRTYLRSILQRLVSLLKVIEAEKVVDLDTELKSLANADARLENLLLMSP